MNEASNQVEIFTCSDCGQTKEITEKSSVNGQHCKQCIAEKRRKQRQKIKQNEPISVDLTENEEQTEKTKKKTSSNKKSSINKKSDPVLINGITAIIMTLTSVVSTRAGEHWAFTYEESNLISQNLCNVLNRFPAFQVANKNSDIVGLGFALTTSLAPRIIASTMKQKEENKSDKKAKVGNLDRKDVGGEAKDNSSVSNRSSKDVLFTVE